MLRSAEAAKGEVRRRGYDLGEAADDRRWEALRNKHRFLGKTVLHLLSMGFWDIFERCHLLIWDRSQPRTVRMIGAGRVRGINIPFRRKEGFLMPRPPDSI